MMKTEKAITLIALIITIIILVILAAVSIRAVYNMGIVNHAVNGTQEYTRTSKEEIDLMKNTEDFLSSTIESIKNAQGVDWEQIMKNAVKPENQTSTNDVGLDANGNIINLDLWDYRFIDGICYLGSGNSLNDGKCYRPYQENWESSQYYIEDVETENLVLPQYIKREGQDFTEVSIIDKYAFYSCGNMKSIKIPDTVTSIGNSAFISCTGLLEIIIPDSVTNVGGTAFNRCTNLKSISLPNSLTSIGYNTFGECTSLVNISIPSSVATIAEYAFNNCKSLTSITIPDLITNIQKNVFSGCEKLTNFTIPNNVTIIGNEAFKGCKGLTNITIPSSITSIGDGAFHTCTGMSYVVIDSTNIAQSIIAEYSYGYIAYYANTIYIKSDISTIGSYITSNFTKQATSDKAGYDKYVKN